MPENEDLAPGPPGGNVPTDSPPADPRNGDRLAELRTLLLGPERTQLVRLRERIEDPARRAGDLSEVLPEAIERRARTDSRLGQALGPLMEDAIRTSVRRNPAPLAAAIFPIIGPAIRRAINAALDEMIQSLNEALNHTFSLRGLRWRWEAIRTGTSFGEVVLRHSLIFRVEEILLIHRETGLLLQHVGVDPSKEESRDMVAGMLTAIQDFARDSFSSAAGDTLETMQLGELTVWI